MKIRRLGGYTYYIGENKDENWSILTSSTDSDDIVFHLTTFPSCYVIMKKESTNDTDDDTEECSENIRILYGAELCKEHSGKYSKIPNIKVTYCSRKFVRKGEKTGELVYIRPKKTYTIRV